MSPEKSHYLFKTYRELFPNRGNLQRSLMGFGFECSDGWFTLIERLLQTCHAPVYQAREALERLEARYAKGLDEATTPLPDHIKSHFGVQTWQAYKERLEEDLAKAVKEAPEVLQVKEKFGGLRFYVSGATPEIQAAIDFAESLSHTICEECGNKGFIVGRSWIRTLCPTHIEETHGEEFLNEIAQARAASEIAREMGITWPKKEPYDD